MKLWVLTAMILFMGQTQTSVPAAKSAVEMLELPLPQYNAYIPGEKLEYDLKYTMITGGHAVMEVKKDFVKLNGIDHYHLYLEGKSNSFFDKLYMVRDYYESFIDKNTLLPTVFNRDILERKFKKKESYIFNRLTNTVKMENREDTISPRTFDIVSAFYYLRSVDFNKIAPGSQFKFTAYFDKEVFPLSATYVGKSVLTTGIGKFNVKVFKPKLIEGRLFTNQANMTLYVSDDSNQVPIRIESDVYLDKVRADLEKFQNLKYKLTSKIK